jgi:hypothetical protein
MNDQDDSARRGGGQAWGQLLIVAWLAVIGLAVTSWGIIPRNQSSGGFASTEWTGLTEAPHNVLETESPGARTRIRRSEVAED